MIGQEIIVLGDSVFKGVVFDAARQRYSLLKDCASQLVQNLLPYKIVNRSQMGRTAPEGLEILKRQAPEDIKDRIVVLEFGGNDCDFNWSEVDKNPEKLHTPRTSSDAFIKALSNMVDFIRKCGGRPLLSTLPPLDCKRYLDWITRNGLSRERIIQFIGEPERIYRWQEYYSSLVLKVAQSLACEYIPLREAFLERVTGEDVWCLDGIHPNALGHQIMADAICRFVRDCNPNALPSNA